MLATIQFLFFVVAVFGADCLAHRFKPTHMRFVYDGVIPLFWRTGQNLLITGLLFMLIGSVSLAALPKILQYLIGIPMFCIIAFFVASIRTWLDNRDNKDEISSDDETLRGATLATNEDIIALRKKLIKVDTNQIVFANIPIDVKTECTHFKLLGGTGTGKSTVIREMIDIARRRGDRLVIADPDGGYLASFFDPERDHILNPFDVRSAKWDMFAEIKTPYDARMVAESIIPRGKAGDEWPEYARTFVAALLGQCKKKGLSVADFWNLAMTASQEVLNEVLAGTQAAPYTEKNNARMLGSIRSVAGTSLAALEHVKDAQGKAMGVRDWMRNGTGTLFIPYQASQISSMRNLVSAWMRLGITELMDMPEQDNRVWFVIDELDAIGRIDGLKDALARIRRMGGRCLLGFQSIAQIYATYGEEDAATIMENCTNTLILRCSASQGGGTSAFASQLVGEREITQTNTSKDHEGRTSTSTSVVKSSLIMPSEFERLPDLSGYVKVAESPVWWPVDLEPYQLPQIAERYIPINNSHVSE